MLYPPLVQPFEVVRQLVLVCFPVLVLCFSGQFAHGEHAVRRVGHGRKLLVLRHVCGIIFVKIWFFGESAKKFRFPLFQRMSCEDLGCEWVKHACYYKDCDFYAVTHRGQNKKDADRLVLTVLREHCALKHSTLEARIRMLHRLGLKWEDISDEKES